MRMKWFSTRHSRARRVCPGLLCGLMPMLCGCQPLRDYRQAVAGQMVLLTHQVSLAKLIDDPHTAAGLRSRLELVQQLRVFAAGRLALPVGRNYRHYVDLHRSCGVWNVEATPPLSLAPKTWMYPVVGRLDYRGHFAEGDARACAETLPAPGWDVFVGGVQAYSTPGWFSDPVLNAFLNNDEARLAEILFHELGHQQVFASGDRDFNEAFATIVD